MYRSFTVLFLFSFLILSGQEKVDNLKFADRLQKVSNDNIFKTGGYLNWGHQL